MTKLHPDTQAALDAGERFARDTNGRTHQLEVRHDDGLYRHLSFRNPESSFYWFDLITWPGHLTFNGDAGTYTYRRVEDMFTFFRTAHPLDHRYRINPGYWAEKITHGGRDSARDYDSDRLANHARMLATDHARDEEWPDDVRDRLLAELEDLISEFGTGAAARGHDMEALYDFEFSYERHTRHGRPLETVALPGDEAPDAADDGCALGEWSWTPSWDSVFDGYEAYQSYDWSFLWACHAIAWGIDQYDAHQAAQQPKEAVPCAS